MGRIKPFQKMKKIILKKQEETIPPQTEENPWFFCQLCTKFLEFKDLIDGCRCCFCQNELFLIPGKEYQKIKEK